MVSTGIAHVGTFMVVDLLWDIRPLSVYGPGMLAAISP
jgi:hypothetical protein